MTQILSGGVYKFINAQVGNCLDLSGEDNTTVIGWDYHGGKNQRWLFTQTPGGWEIRNLAHGKYLNVAGNPHDGVSVVATEDPCEWYAERDEQDFTCWRFTIPGTPFTLDLTGHGNPTPGTPITLWGKWEGRNQCWRLEEV